MIALESGFDEAPFNGGQPFGSTPTDPNYCQPLPVVGPAHYRFTVELEFPEAENLCHCPKCREKSAEFLRVMIEEQLLAFFRNTDPYRLFPEEMGIGVEPLKGGAK